MLNGGGGVRYHWSQVASGGGGCRYPGLGDIARKVGILSG